MGPNCTRSQGCRPMTVSNHFLYAKAKRLCSGLQQLSRILLTKLCSKGSVGGQAPLFRRLLSRESGRDALSTSISSPACLCLFTTSLSSQPWTDGFCRPGSLSLRWTELLPPLVLLQWWCWCFLLQWCHR